jgi:glutamate-1-semialdehyde 2,1-aminomutase
MDELQLLSMLALTLAGATWAVPRGKQRLELSRAKHRSLAGHSRIAKRVAALIPGYAYDEDRFFNSDEARRRSRRNAAPVSRD